MTTFCLALSADIGVMQERTASPSMCTVQAPHWPSPQPKRGPLKREIVAQRIEQRHLPGRRIRSRSMLPFTVSVLVLPWTSPLIRAHSADLCGVDFCIRAFIALTPVTGRSWSASNPTFPGPRIGVNDSILLGYTEGTCGRHVRSGSRLCENPTDAMIPLLNRGGNDEGFRSRGGSPAGDAVAGMPR